MNAKTKHYIRISENKHIIHGFSEAFEQPLETDICITEKGGRHFELLGKANPCLKDENGIFRFKFEITPMLRTEEEKQPELDTINALPKPKSIEERLDILDEALIKVKSDIYDIKTE